MDAKIICRRGTSTQWNAANPTLAEGEIGIQIDPVENGQAQTSIKVGDGLKSRQNLPYITSLIGVDDTNGIVFADGNVVSAELKLVMNGDSLELRGHDNTLVSLVNIPTGVITGGYFDPTNAVLLLQYMSSSGSDTVSIDMSGMYGIFSAGNMITISSSGVVSVDPIAFSTAMDNSISSHNTSAVAHQDIRTAINNETTRATNAEAGLQSSITTINSTLEQINPSVLEATYVAQANFPDGIVSDVQAGASSTSSYLSITKVSADGEDTEVETTAIPLASATITGVVSPADYSKIQNAATNSALNSEIDRAITRENAIEASIAEAVQDGVDEAKGYTDQVITELEIGSYHTGYDDVSDLPTPSWTVTGIYLVGTAEPYDMYVVVSDGTNHSWKKIGSTSVDLSAYATTASVAATYATKSEVSTGLAGKVGTLDPNATNAVPVLYVNSMTTAAYNALATKNSQTLYVLTD